MTNTPGFRPGLARYFRSAEHFWMAAVLLGSAFSMHFEYFWNCEALGLLPLEPEPLDPLPDEPEPEDPLPPAPPPRAPSEPWSCEIGFGFGGAVIVCFSPTFEKSSENVTLPPVAPLNCDFWLSGIEKSTFTLRRRSVSSSLPT